MKNDEALKKLIISLWDSWDAESLRLGVCLIYGTGIGWGEMLAEAGRKYLIVLDGDWKEDECHCMKEETVDIDGYKYYRILDTRRDRDYYMTGMVKSTKP